MIDPEQLLEIATELAKTTGRGRPRLVALRRSISTSYYALFHFLLASAADLLVGAVERDLLRYNLAYRALNHGVMKSICSGITKNNSPHGFGVDIRKCAVSFVELQESRHKADYDPSAQITLSDAKAAIKKADSAMKSLKAASEIDRRLFLTVMHFKPRS